MDASWNAMKRSVLGPISAASVMHKDKQDVCLAAPLLPCTLCSPKQMVKCECTSHMTSKERQKPISPASLCSCFLFKTCSRLMIGATLALDDLR